MIAIYARQSIDKKESISIETQVSICRNEISEKSEYKVYHDKGFSGKNTARPAFSELMRDIDNGKINKLIVYRLDRISRSITDFANIMDILEEKHIDFVSANEKFDTSTPVGRAMLYIVMVFAQLERETIAERIRDNYYSRGKTGVWLGGPAPFGFENKKITVSGKKLSTIEANSDINTVIKIFESYAYTNISLSGLARRLLKEHGGIWNNIKLSRILHNPAYVKADADIFAYYSSKNCIIVNAPEEFTGKRGCNLYGKRDRNSNKYRITSDHVLSLSIHDGVIDSRTWLICQHKLDSNRQIKNSGKGKHSWLTGLIKCGYCGHAMNVKVTKNGNKYLNCTGKYSTEQCTHKHSTHKAVTIEKYVYKEICEILKEFKATDIILQAQTVDNRTNELKLQLLDIENQIESLVNNLTGANEVLISYANRKITQLDSRRKEIAASLEQSCQQCVKKLSTPDLSDWYSLDITSKHDIAALLIDRINIFNEKIEIIWKC